MKSFIDLPPVQPGDRVAVVSPSAGLPGLFPHVFEQGLQRLRAIFDLHPVEYPTTRQMHSSPQERARDLMAAFADPHCRAVFASVGGDDQIRVLPFLDEELFQRHPKPFFGYSDNTHLHCFLWKLGIPSYYGGAIMVQFAMQQSMHALTAQTLQQAIFARGEVDLEVSPTFTEEELEWSDPLNLTRPRVQQVNPGWDWDGAGDGEGLLWGGCLESLGEQLQAGRHLPSPEELDGAILYIETSEELPDAAYVQRVLTGLGERGLLAGARALLVGRAKAWSLARPLPHAERRQYRAEQREAVLAAFRSHNPTAPVVQNLDFGHTDPQIPLPNGGRARVLSASRRITVTY